MEKIEEYYKEKRWTDYIKIFGDNWTNSQSQIQLLDLCKNKIDLAMIIDYHLDKQSLNWMKSNIPVLDNLTPLECLEDENLIKRLKVCLMRFPC